VVGSGIKGKGEYSSYGAWEAERQLKSAAMVISGRAG
jgi:hypothetical protein